MATCEWCGEDVVYEAAFTCNYCDETFCSDHRLPENHRCLALRASDSLGPNFEGLYPDEWADLGWRDGEEEQQDNPTAEEPDGGEAEPGREHCERCGEPTTLRYCRDCLNDLLNDDATSQQKPTGPGDQVISEPAEPTRAADQSPEKTPCEKCGRPCPVDKEYCSPCRKDLINRHNTATQEDILEHWQRTGQATVTASDEGRDRGLGARVGRRVVVIGVAAGIVGGAVRYGDRIADVVEDAAEGGWLAGEEPATAASADLEGVGIASADWNATTLTLTFQPDTGEFDGWALHRPGADPTDDRIAAGAYEDGSSVEIEIRRVEIGDSNAIHVTAYTGEFARYGESGSLIWGDRGPTAAIDTPGSGSANDGADSESGVDEAAVEGHVHELVNAEREERDLRALEWDGDLQTVADDHSRDMIERDFFAHDNPDGEGPSDRYDRHRISGCSTSGENIAQTWWDENVVTPDGTERYTTEADLAAGIVEQWMNSEGHRENILRSEWRQEGIGVELSDADEVFATQNFCG